MFEQKKQPETEGRHEGEEKNKKLANGGCMTGSRQVVMSFGGRFKWKRSSPRQGGQKGRKKLHVTS